MPLFLFALVSVALYFYLLMSRHFGWFDLPDEARKNHSFAKPTSAGMVFLLPVLIYLAYLSFTSNQQNVLHQAMLVNLSISLLVVVCIGAIDDFINLSAKLRLVVLTSVSAYVLYVIFKEIELSRFMLVFYLLSMIWWINLFNFMDGSDGMAALHSLVAFSFYLIALWNTDYQLLITLCLVVMSAFLLFNFPKSRMFMGDSGSLGVSLLITWLAFEGMRLEAFGEIFVVSIHLVFIVDATLTFFLRLIKKHKVTQAHSLHCYQSLIHHGASHAVVSSFYAVIGLITAAVGLYMLKMQFSWLLQVSILAFETLILVVLWFKFTDLKRFELQ